MLPCALAQACYIKNRAAECCLPAGTSDERLEFSYSLIGHDVLQLYLHRISFADYELRMLNI
jgi:hypothetical protein